MDANAGEEKAKEERRGKGTRQGRNDADDVMEEGEDDLPSQLVRFRGCREAGPCDSLGSGACVRGWFSLPELAKGLSEEGKGEVGVLGVRGSSSSSSESSEEDEEEEEEELFELWEREETRAQLEGAAGEDALDPE